MKKCSSYFSLCLLIVFTAFFSAPASTSANDFGYFPYWYSDDSKIGVFSSIKVIATKTSNFAMSNSNYENIINYSPNTWNSTINKPVEAGTTSNYTLHWHGVSRTEANSLGLPSNAAGVTSINSSTSIGTANGNTKTVYQIDKATIILIWDTNTTSSYSLNKWKAVAAHEYGHAMGYFGHDTTANSTNKSLMAPTINTIFDSWGVTSPTLRDSRHMDNLY